MKIRNQKLHILGKVSSLIIKKLQKSHNLTIKPNAIFLFVGYTFNEFKTGSLFDIVIKESNQAWNHDYKIRLEKVYDEFGRPYSHIPEGYKTICLFECKQAIPEIIKNLPVLKTWDVTDNAIYLCNHSDIDLLHTPSNDTIVFKTLEGLIISGLQKKGKKRFTIKDVEAILPKESSKLIINNMLISGSIRKNNEELILTN